jgi:hypothetical protein
MTCHFKDVQNKISVDRLDNLVIDILWVFVNKIHEEELDELLKYESNKCDDKKLLVKPIIKETNITKKTINSHDGVLLL